jgi:mannose-1-phosphate guanylyltransferase / phosphomannomutase
MGKKEIFCPWELKGKIMRTLITEKDTEKVELLDGVKFIRENGWALVLPDADKTMLRVYSEGAASVIAEDISDFYIDKIKVILNTSAI